MFTSIWCHFLPADKKITNVACGSAHTVAWSTSKPIHAGRLPSKIPMEYNLLKDIPIHVIRNRLVLLHHFSELFCPSIPMFDLQEKPESGGSSMGTLAGIDALRGLLVSSGKVLANNCQLKWSPKFGVSEFISFHENYILPFVCLFSYD